MLPPLRPTFQAALRDIHANSSRARAAAAERLSEPEPGREEAAIDGLLTLLSDDQFEVRIQAIRSLGRIADAKVLNRLIDCLEDVQEAIREEAIIAIAQIQGVEAENTLRKALRNSYPEVRLHAVQYYVELSQEPNKEEILELLRDEHPRVRAATANVLKRFDSPNIREKLTDALGDADEEVQVEAALSLAKMGDERAIPQLRKSLKERVAVLDVLSALSDLNDTGSIDEIYKLSQGLLRSPIIKAEAARSMIRLGDKRGIKLLHEVLTSWRWEGRSYAVQIIGELGLVQFVDHLERLSKKPRGVDHEVLQLSLSKLTEIDHL